jgi:hypothetical protein
MACCCAAKAGPAETINAQDDALKKEVSKAVQEAQAMLAPVEPTIGDDGKKFGFVTPQREFECQIGVHGQKLGIDINYHDGATVLITKINEGPIHEYNKKGPEELLLVGDRFTKVNDVEGEVKMLLEAVKKEDIMVCTVRRAYERTIHLMRREDGQEHGIQVEKFDEMSVFLLEDPEEGTLCAINNAEEPDYILKKNDYITKVNDVEGNPEALIAELEKGDSWEISWRRIERRIQEEEPAEEPAEPDEPAEDN